MSMSVPTPLEVYAATFVYALLGGVVPLFNLEAYMLSLSVLSPQTEVLPAVLAAAAGQMTAKALVYLAGRGLRTAPKVPPRFAEATVRLSGSRRQATAVLVVSAVTGLPPFYGVCLGAGFVGYPFAAFLGWAIAGRLLHFAGIFLIPRLAWP